MSAIEVRELSKVFKVPVREAGLGAALRSLARRKHRMVRAVDCISFSMAQGEIVGFLGPNGAGKTTTLKMLSGLLYPTAGEVNVLGRVPSRREREYLQQITLIMGQRNQLVWDIPAIDSFDLHRAIYRIPRGEFTRVRDDLVEMLEIGDLINKPVRNLSLGERMRVEICAALLHSPQVLFLDEPTIGLDVTMQRRIRAFISEYNRRHEAAVLLTSHYMADVKALCERVILIDRGRLLFDGKLSALSDRFGRNKVVTMRLDGASTDLAQYGEVVSEASGKAVLRVARPEVPGVTARLLRELPIQDLTVEDPPIEEVVEEAFAGRTEDGRETTS